MRPPRDDIAAPPFPPDASWVDGAERDMERLTAAGPVLTHFFDFAQLNAVRTLPYLAAWHRRYEAAGLVVLGVHAPRWPLSERPDALAAAVEHLDIPYPVVNDGRRSLWADYGCHGWPSLFLWSRGGVLRWYHFGEGEYRASEEAIQVELATHTDSLPDPLEPLRPGDAPGAKVIAPTPELLPGGSERKPWRTSAEQPSIEIEYEAGGAFASLDGDGALRLALDGSAPTTIEVDHPGLYELVSEGAHSAHRLELQPDPGVLVYSVSFAAGVR